MTLLSLLLLSTAPLAAPPLPEPELAEMRGGFALPGGLNVAIAIQSDTKVDGSLLLRTVYKVDQAATLVVYAPIPNGGENSSLSSSSGQTPSQGVTIMFDRQNGARIGPVTSAAPTINIAGGTGDIGGAPPDTAPVDLAANGSAVDVPGGKLSLTQNANGQRVQLQGDRLDVRHLVGNAVGSIVANSGSDRVIESATTVALDISGATPMNLGSSMMKIDTLVSDTTAQLLPR